MDVGLAGQGQFRSHSEWAEESPISVCCLSMEGRRSATFLQAGRRGASPIRLE
jgi:hypothetical protein